MSLRSSADRRIITSARLWYRLADTSRSFVCWHGLATSHLRISRSIGGWSLHGMPKTMREIFFVESGAMLCGIQHAFQDVFEPERSLRAACVEKDLCRLPRGPLCEPCAHALAVSPQRQSPLSAPLPRTWILSPGRKSGCPSASPRAQKHEDLLHRPVQHGAIANTFTCIQPRRIEQRLHSPG